MEQEEQKVISTFIKPEINESVQHGKRSSIVTQIVNSSIAPNY